MQFTGGSYQVLDSQSNLVGFMACGVVSGMYYDWFAASNANPFSTPLNLKNYSFGYNSNQQAWISNLPATPTVADWEAGFSAFLDSHFGSGNWSKKNKYKASQQTW